jgi:hypothetical protein
MWRAVSFWNNNPTFGESPSNVSAASRSWSRRLHCSKYTIVAAEITITCAACGFHAAYWEDGAPYIQGSDGTRHHYFHPGAYPRVVEIVTGMLGREPKAGEVDDIVARHAGNESPYLCRQCLGFSTWDPRRDTLKCSVCDSSILTAISDLAGKKCPSCRTGDMDSGAVSAVS